MFTAKTYEKLGVFNVATSSNHDRHIKTMRCYLFLSRIKFINKIPPLLALLQIQIARKIGGAEWAIAKGNEKIKELKKEISKTKDIKAVKAIQRKVNLYAYKLSINKHLVKEWKWIADGIAWRFLKYQRNKIRMLSANWSSGALDFLSRGFKSELGVAFQYAFSRFKPLVICDITHYLRIGDIIVKHANNKYEILEVKKGKFNQRQRRWQRQRERMDDVIGFLNTGVMETSKGNIILRKYNIPIKNYLNEVLKLIRLSKKKYTASKKFDDILSVAVKNYGKVIKEIKMKKNTDAEELMKKMNIEKLNNDSDDLVFTCLSYDYFYEGGGEFLRVLVPYTIFPFPARCCLDILSGKICLISEVNLTKLKDLFEKRGWEVEIQDIKKIYKEFERAMKRGKFRKVGASREIIEEDLFKITKDNFSTTIPVSLIVRIGYEFLNSETLVSLAEEMRKQRFVEEKDRKMIGTMVELSKEEEIWN